MTPSAWRGLKLGAALLLAAILQAAFANALKVFGGRPDLILTTALVGSMFCGEGASALLGFSAGLLHASLAAPPHAGVGSILVSRTIACVGIGCLEERVYRDSVTVALIVVLLGTLSAECLFFLFNPQHNLPQWARSAALTLVWNVALAAPCYCGIRTLLGKHRDAP